MGSQGCVVRWVGYDGWKVVLGGWVWDVVRGPIREMDSCARWVTYETYVSPSCDV